MDLVMNGGVQVTDNRHRAAIAGIVNGVTFCCCFSCCCCYYFYCCCCCYYYYYYYYCYRHTSPTETVGGLPKQDFLLTTQQFELLSKYQRKTLLQMPVFSSGNGNKNLHL